MQDVRHQLQPVDQPRTGPGEVGRGFDRDHYDVPAEWYDEVLARGVEPVSSRELVRRLVAAGLRRRKSQT